MKPHIILFGLALVLLSTQLGSAQAASCQDIAVEAEDIFAGRASTEYFYFPVHNYSGSDFEVYAAEAWRDSGKFEITLIDYPDEIFADGSGELAIRVKTGSLDNESLGSAYVKIRGNFDDGTYCGFTNIDETYFDVTVEMGNANAQCNDLGISAFDVYIQENSDKTVSFEIENHSDEDFDLDGIEVEENSGYFEASVYSKPSVISDNGSETFRVKIESESVSGDREGSVKLRAKGRFGNGTYCPYSGTEEETFGVFVGDSSGSGTTHTSNNRGIYFDSGTVRVEKGGTGTATLFIGNNSAENFTVDYVTVFDSSQNFSVETAGYERVVPAFGTGYVNVKARAYDNALAGKGNAFIEIRGHFQNGEMIDVFGDSFGIFQVEIVERQQHEEDAGNETGLSAACPDVSLIAPEHDYSDSGTYSGVCPGVSLIVPGEKAIGSSGSVFITIDNRSLQRVDVRLYGAGLTIQPKLISVPRKTLVSESVSVSSVLPETSLVYSIGAAGCSSTKATRIVSNVPEQPPAENGENGEGSNEAGFPFGIDSTGFAALGQAGAVLGLLVLAAAMIYLIFRPASKA